MTRIKTFLTEERIFGFLNQVRTVDCVRGAQTQTDWRLGRRKSPAVGIGSREEDLNNLVSVYIPNEGAESSYTPSMSLNVPSGRYETYPAP